MKSMNLVCAAGAALALTGCACLECPGNNCSKSAVSAQEQAENMQKVCDFVKTAGHYFIATADGDQPRVRPFGTMNIFDGKLYIQTGKVKKVSKQIGKNPKVEICAFMQDKGQWIRISGKLVNDDRREAKAAMLDAYPSLKSMYSADDENTQVLYFESGEATIYSFTSDPVVLKF